MDKNFLILLSIECFTVLLVIFLFFFLYRKFKSPQSPKIVPGSGKGYWSVPGWNWKRDFDFLEELITRYTEREFDIILLEVNNRYGINKDAIIKDNLCNEHAILVASKIWKMLGEDYKALLMHYLGTKEICMEYISSEVHFKMLKLTTSKNRTTVTKKFNINPTQPEIPIKVPASSSSKIKRSDI